MAWTNQSAGSFPAGHVVTATEYQTLVNNDNHLRGQDGTAEFEGHLALKAGVTNKDLGSASSPWRTGYLTGELRIGDSGNLSSANSGLSSFVYLARNVYYDGSYKRIVGENDAAVLSITDAGDLVFYGNTDVNVAVGSAVTLQERIRVTKAGIFTYQLPGFAAHQSSPVTNVTGDGTLYTVLFDAEDYDSNAAYAPGTGKFTAPYTGMYQFDTSLFIENVNGSLGSWGTSSIRLILQTTGGSYTLYRVDPALVCDTLSNILGVSGSLTVPMTAGHEAYIFLQHVGNPAGKVTVITLGTFAGQLVAKTA